VIYLNGAPYITLLAPRSIPSPDIFTY